MCGIVAMFARGVAPVRAERLERATQQLAHRGPDGHGIWVSENGRVGLGHTRLSIIDLATGDQPIASEDDRLHIVTNGEFYDYERLQRDLTARGHRLRTRADSEVALHLYEDLGTQCLHHLRGEFAFALWDDRNQTLFAARDRFGIKPLYYTTVSDTLMLASEVKALFAAGAPARWDRAAFFQANHVTVPPLDRSLFQGIYQVPPGHFLLATREQVQVLRYWDFNYPLAEASRAPRSDQEYAEAFCNVLDEAVRLRLRADVPVGCYLSGGLDSCAVLGLAARHRVDRVRAFTLTFDRAEYDEGPIAREMAARVNAEFHPIAIRQSDLADHFADAAWSAETLFLNAHGVAKFLLSRAVRQAGYKVVLTGEGSDEILAGYPHFRRDMLLYNTQGQDGDTVARLLAELERTNPVSRGLLLPDGRSVSLTSVEQSLGFVPSFLASNATAAWKLRSLYSAEFQTEFADHDPYRIYLNALDVEGQLTGREPVNQALYLWSKTQLPNYVLCVLGDRMEMAHSVEGRVPLLDHHVVELVRNLPVAQKIRGMTEKFILREAARPVLTATVYARQKHPFLSPPALNAPEERLNQLLQDTLRGPVLAAMPFYDQARVIALLNTLPTMDPGQRTAWDLPLMIILSACMLHERFGLEAA